MSSKNAVIFVTRLPRDIIEDDIKKAFRSFGKIKEITLKRGFGFVGWETYEDNVADSFKEYENYKDAKKAISEMQGRRLNGQRIVVEKAGERRSVKQRKGPQPEDKCFNCNEKGHWLIY